MFYAVVLENGYVPLVTDSKLEAVRLAYDINCNDSLDWHQYSAEIIKGLESIKIKTGLTRKQIEERY